MNDEQLEEKRRLIDQIQWYHEFDFPDGLKARSQLQATEHRRVWAFMKQQLDAIEFHGKSVLDLGCWDGYWSFEAERRGARRVLATDDWTQNWAASSGIHLAKDLLRSSIEINLETSVYDLGGLNEKFDVILCMGIYYHLVDPFYAFAQIRHRCHQDTVIVFEGDTTLSLPNSLMRYDLTSATVPCFVPTPSGLTQMLQACYFTVESQALMEQQGTPENQPQVLAEIARGDRELPDIDRLVTIARPFSGENVLHFYRPPFGLHTYDTRFDTSYEDRLSDVDDTEFVRALYREILCREPDSEGLIANVEFLRGKSRRSLIQRFFLSDERRKHSMPATPSTPDTAEPRKQKPRIFNRLFGQRTR